MPEVKWYSLATVELSPLAIASIAQSNLNLAEYFNRLFLFVLPIFEKTELLKMT